MYKCKYFAPHELVPEEVYNKYFNKDDIYLLFDERALRILDMIREWAGVGLTVNNWFWGGARTQSGLRDKNSPVGAPKSAHKLGKAFDVVSPKITTQQLWTLLQQHIGELPCRIRIEKTSGGHLVNWLHFDTNAAPGQKEAVYFFNA
jgi:hypothetical protein